VPEELTRLDALEVMNVDETYLGAAPREGLLGEAPGQVTFPASEEGTT